LDIKKKIRGLLQWPGKTYLKNQLESCKFSIISNDCFGAEMYRWIDRPYNTPFVGLMVMAPCYISLVQDFEQKIYQPLRFVKYTKYPGMEHFWLQRNQYPIGLIDDVEIHFLHYQTENEAYDKWNRRRDKLDLDNLRFKFCTGKDYASPELVKLFDALKQPFKLCLGEESISGYHSFAYIPGLPYDGAAAFRHSLQYINLINWLQNGDWRFENEGQKIIGRLLKESLRR
jgi:uncharacterized protein (DUF1919 family)